MKLRYPLMGAAFVAAPLVLTAPANGGAWEKAFPPAE